MRRWGIGLAALLLSCGADPEDARLSLEVLDAATGAPLAARIELLDADGEAWVPAQALPLRFECFAAPLPDWAAGFVSLSDRIAHQPSGTDQFYLDGEGTVALPAGTYRLRAFRGIETKVFRHEIAIGAGEHARIDVRLERWADLASEGWWSVDDHVHITRRTPDEDRSIAAWMSAEDLRVANLLQMGTVDQIGVTPQHDFGAAGEYRRGDTQLFAGQEHPRTHFLGHTITLGADALVDRRDTYIAYDTTFAAGLERGGLPGYAHWGIGPAQTGLAIYAPLSLVFFVEVLQFDFPFYRVWYDLLDLGLRVAPTAGTDFPCGILAGAPGRERFYMQLDAPPTRASMVEAVRAGRTFVTNGPLLELEVDGVGIGGELRLEAPGRVPVEARVRFDPERDSIEAVELVVNGVARPLTPTAAGPGEQVFETEVEIVEPSWLALRVSGDKVGETPIFGPPPRAALWFFDQAFDFREVNRRSEEYYASRSRVRPSAAHSAAIFATLPDAAPTDRAVDRAAEAIARLDDLESRLSDARIEDQTLWDWFPYSDAVPLEHLRRNRPALLRAIAAARERYAALTAQNTE